MKRTSVDLYRMGNATTARFDVLRPFEILTQHRNGEDWALSRSGGASTFDAPTGLRGTHWWKLSAQTSYDDSRLYLWQDAANHWSWDPATDMKLTDYLAALGEVNLKFVHTP